MLNVFPRSSRPMPKEEGGKGEERKKRKKGFPIHPLPNTVHRSGKGTHPLTLSKGGKGKKGRKEGVPFVITFLNQEVRERGGKGEGVALYYFNHDGKFTACRRCTSLEKKEEKSDGLMSFRRRGREGGEKLFLSQFSIGGKKKEREGEEELS